MLRVQGHFATVYAVGCLAIRFDILPFTEAELLAAILSCHRDHVAFVDNEVAGGPRWTVDAAGASEFVAAGSVRKPIAGAVVPARRPSTDSALHQSQQPRGRRGFIDLRSPGLSRLRFKRLKVARCDRRARLSSATSANTTGKRNIGFRMIRSRRSPGTPARRRR